jgi:hypothetical protein
VISFHRAVIYREDGLPDCIPFADGGTQIVHSVKMEKRSLWLDTVVSRASIVFFSLSVMAFLLFLLGNLQEFLDSTQVMLLQIAGVTSFLYVVAAIYFVGIGIVFRVHRERVGWHRLVLVVAGLIVEVGILLVANFIQSWIEQVL